MRTKYFVITKDKPLICAQGALCSVRRWRRDNLGKDDARVCTAHSLPFIFYTSPSRRIERWRHAPLIDKPGGAQIVTSPSPLSITEQRSQRCSTGMRRHSFGREH